MTTKINLAKDLNYLNLDEIKYLSKKYDIPIDIYYYKNNKLHKSGNILRKTKIINMLIGFINGKKYKKFILNQNVVSFEKKVNINENDIVYFGQYKYHIAKPLMSKLVKNKYEACASHVMLYELWGKGIPFTYSYFAVYYDKEYDKYKKIKHPEWAYNTDIANGTEYGNNWIDYRNKISENVLQYFDDILA